MSEKSNRLIHESSPYLQQHAYNPVDWYPWGDEALKKAVEEDKPIILSIGYSSCHWCHVMERESFEQKEIAELMNRHFINIKLDREERPDIDQVYMEAIQSMGLQGGWPLNVFLTPSQEPFYGGTYFPPQQWAHLLVNIAKAYRNNRQELQESAKKFREALNTGILERYGLGKTEDLDRTTLVQAANKLVTQFDTEEGGTAKAPKFPMPVIWQFLLHHYALYRDDSILKQVHLTLERMAYGGIYDQIGGGFARYSVDAHWFAPHFEKMLYDNAQLISLYALAYSQSKNPLYRDIIEQTIGFVRRELTDRSGAFYAALDADSEGVEGKYYTWEHEDFLKIVGDDGDFLLDYYGITPEGNWEEGRNILHRKVADAQFAQEHSLDLTWMQNTIVKYRAKLLDHRANRVPPGLDDKIICGWNGLMIKGLTDAFAALGNQQYLKMAEGCAGFIEKNMRKDDQLFRTYRKKGHAVPGFLEDYAAVIRGYLGLYQVTFNERWLYKAQNLTGYVIKEFLDKEDGLFYYTGRSSQALIARKKELFDNVIPASNSVMANNLVELGTLLQRQDYLDIAQKMVARVIPLIFSDPAYLSNWAIAHSWLSASLAEVVIAGREAHATRRELAAYFHPHKVMLGSDQPSDLPSLQDRFPEEGTLIYVCYNRTCQMPTNDPQEAIQQLSMHTS